MNFTLIFLQVLREGNRGYGILVSSAPKESNAFYSLRDPSEVITCFRTRGGGILNMRPVLLFRIP